MHWTEVLALLIIFLALIPVLILFGYVVLLVWGSFQYWIESRRIDLSREYRCEQGVFIRKEHSWVAEIDRGGGRLSIDVRDDYGSPDAAFLRRLPDILANLADLERAARRDVAEVTDDYALDGVLSPVRPDDNYEFSLGFSPKDEESYEMSIYVNFKGDRVVGWLGVD